MKTTEELLESKGCANLCLNLNTRGGEYPEERIWASDMMEEYTNQLVVSSLSKEKVTKILEEHSTALFYTRTEKDAELIVNETYAKLAAIKSFYPAVAQEMLEALIYYKNGIDHFYNCINFNLSFLDAEAITFMNTVGIKINSAIKKATE